MFKVQGIVASVKVVGSHTKLDVTRSKSAPNILKQTGPPQDVAGQALQLLPNRVRRELSSIPATKHRRKRAVTSLTVFQCFNDLRLKAPPAPSRSWLEAGRAGRLGGSAVALRRGGGRAILQELSNIAWILKSFWDL